MSQLPQGTPYTPIFPSGVASSSKLSSNKSLDESNDDRRKVADKPYIDRLKERYLLLSSLPQKLDPTSYTLDPHEQTKIDAWVAWIRERREKRLPLELPLTCVGVRGGDWVGEPNDDIEEDEYILPIAEKEWFNWERTRQLRRQERQRQQLEEERRSKIAQWTEQVQNGSEITGVLSQQDQLSLLGSLVGDEFSTASIRDSDGVRSRYLRPVPSFHNELPQISLEPVDRMTSPPPAPMLDPLLDFNESVGVAHSYHSNKRADGLLKLSGNSAPSLPHIFTLEDHFIPFRLHSPSFALTGRDISTPRRTIQQLSSPISPPRHIKQLAPSESLLPAPSDLPSQSPSHISIQLPPSSPLSALSPSHPPPSHISPQLPPSSPLSALPSSHPLPLQTLLSHPPSQKRMRESEVENSSWSTHHSQQDQEGSIEPTTPHASKRAKGAVEPITPQSVERPSSQTFRSSQQLARLPTLTELLKSRGSSRRGTPARRRSDNSTPVQLTRTPRSAQQRIATEDEPHFSPSQPVSYAMFRPQFESTQCRASSLPPSPGDVVGAIQPDPFKLLSAGSSSVSFYQSQFNVENNIGAVAAFLTDDIVGSDT
ncbi:hypothetical protein BU17DRAFT_71824 [Hysterangium stoloniferum]|nr:hypothetical protein BU17DRAFT_71824 [Hysterangium stoloniferum]